MPGDLYLEPSIRDLCARPDADATFERIAAGMPTEHPEPELVATLTALAVLRARHAAERLG